ncbi:MAG: UDP-N-acetylglucosamine--N-acetylmuramyl-(pentapeptide) pyrophosphoryl-undecaprenol N-acetylglucosamine transferase [Rickettsiales bacterium]
MKIVCVGGGTMGHVNPAVSILNYAIKNHNLEGHLITDLKCKSNIKDLNTAEDNIFILNISKTPKNIISIPFMIFEYIKCLYASIIYLNKIKPNYIIGFGGYVSVFPIIAASLLNIFYSIVNFFTNENTFVCKILIHEQNKIPGKANILLSYFASCVALSFPDTDEVKKFFCKTHYTGNPIRDNLENFTQNAKQNKNTFNILIFAGSQGSKVLNEKIPEIINNINIKFQNFNIKISHQSNEATKKLLEEKYKNYNIEAKISNYFENIEAEYQQADLVICRSGASSIFELIATAKPAILIPYPFAYKDHQLLNAKYLIDNEAGFIVLEQNIESELYQVLLNIFNNIDILDKCKLNLKKLKNNSTKKLMELILS